MSDAGNTYPPGPPAEPPGGVVGGSAGAEDEFPVQLPSGATFPVLTQPEVEYLEERIERYNADNHFTNISDLQDLDRLLLAEMFVFRWNYWLSIDSKYDGSEINEIALRRSVKDHSVEIRQLKAQLGIDKSSRDRAKGEDNVADYLLTLRQRAREFGIHRDEQVAKLYELGNQFIALRTLNKNCLPEEQRELGITDQDLLEWVDGVYTIEFQALDVPFRSNQKMWVRDL